MDPKIFGSEAAAEEAERQYQAVRKKLREQGVVKCIDCGRFRYAQYKNEECIGCCAVNYVAVDGSAARSAQAGPDQAAPPKRETELERNRRAIEKIWGFGR